MGIFLKKRGAGYDPRWHGSWQVDGVRKIVALNLWRGTPPKSGEEHGDAKFERSRGEAERLFQNARDGKKSVEEELVIAQKVHAARYGRKVELVKIADLRDKWDALPHKADLTEARRERVHSVLGRFEDFMGERFPKVKEAGALTAEHFKAFLADVEKHGSSWKNAKGRGGEGKKTAPREEQGGVSARTWNDVLDILRGVLRKVDGQSAGFREYLATLPKRAEKTIHRRPFTGGELEAVFAAAREVDSELFPVIVAAACTALRRGDVARLRWKSLDMTEGFVTVKTTKTGEDVEIPIFPPFMVVLKEAARKRRAGIPFVFPEVAHAYRIGPDALNRRLRKVLAAAGFVRPERAAGGEFPAPSSPDDAVARVEAGMKSARWTEKKREKGLAILQRHLQGETGKAIASGMGIAQSVVSSFLHQMEKTGNVALVSRPKLDAPTTSTLAEFKEGEQRKQRGSLCGWHSFRTTFCTLALENGVPMEILRKITGHRTAEIVLKHYDRRGRAAMKKAIGAAMPKALVGAIEGAGKRNVDKEELEAVPADLARAARKLEESGLGDLLADADAATLAAVRQMLKKGGTK